MEFRSAALVGAGAIGGFFIKGLSEALGSSFCLVASGERADRLRKNGLVINGEQVYFNVCSPQEAAGADLILVATKYNSLPGILEDVRYMTGPGRVSIRYPLSRSISSISFSTASDLACTVWK